MLRNVTKSKQFIRFLQLYAEFSADQHTTHTEKYEQISFLDVLAHVESYVRNQFQHHYLRYQIYFWKIFEITAEKIWIHWFYIR